MDNRDDNGAHTPSGGDWEAQKRRDDTPSFIRNVQARAEMLHPSRSGDEAIPVLTMPQSVRIWRRVRWPLLVVVVVALLTAVGLFTNDRLEARSVKRRIAEAGDSEKKATVEALTETDQMLAALAERHTGRANAQVARAWHAVLMGQMFGPADTYLAQAQQAIELAGADSSAKGYAARAGVAHAAGDTETALQLVGDGLGAYATEPRLHLVKAWILRGADKGEAADETLMLLRKLEPDYLPALHTQLAYALEDDDRERARDLVAELLGKSRGNLFASLASVAIRLPRWGEPDPDLEALASLVRDNAALDKRIKKAPPDLQLLGRRLSGRVKLLTRQLNEAIEDLNFVGERTRDAESLAWKALAIRELEGPEAALAALDASGADLKAPEILDVRARCLLDRHRVDQAGEVFAALESVAPSLASVSELKWILAVRRADLAGALDALPKRIDGRLRWVGLEMYELVRGAGDEQGLESLLASMQGATKACGDGIRAWHDTLDSALDKLSGESKKPDPCLVALKAKLLRGHLKPTEIKAAAEKTHQASGGDLRLEVDRALAVWLVDGQAAAAGVLGEIEKLEPEGASVRLAMGDAFLRIGLPQRAASTVEGLDDPVAVDIRIRAYGQLELTKQRDEQLADALTRAKTEDHPALAYWVMQRDLDKSQFDDVVKRADAVLPRAGRYTAEIAELKAKALSAIGARGDADRALDAAARSARKAVGLDEAWEAKLTLIRHNLRRGGAFLFKAVAITTELYKEGLKDAELSYSYAVANIRQGNERGAMRYLRESLELDPSFVPAYSQLQLLGKLSDENLALLGKVKPGAQP